MFIENYSRSDHRGAQAQPKFTGHSGSTYGCSNKDDGDGREYSVAIEYRGTEDGQDFYWVSYTIPSGPAAATASSEIAYFGLEIELWRDSQWRIGIRPHTPTGEPDGAANRSQPIRSEKNSTPSAVDSGR